MKTKIFFLLLFLFPVFPALAQEPTPPEPLLEQGKGHGVFDPFLPGDTLWVFGDKVNVRAAPRKDADIAFKLSIGDEVVVLDTAKAETLSGLNANWYRVQYRGNQTGFIWGGLLAACRFRIGDVDVLCGLNYGKISDTDKKDDLNVVFRAAKNGQLLSTAAYDDVSFVDGPYMLSWRIPNLGLTRFAGGIKTWVGVEACGYPQQDMYVFWDGARLVKMPLVHSVADGGVFYHVESYVFPYMQYEFEREAQKVYLKVEHYEAVGDNEDDIEFDEWTKQRLMQWDGREYVKPDIR